MIKRILLIPLVFVMIFSLAACNENIQDNSTPTENNDHTVDVGEKDWIWVGPRSREGALAPEGYYYIDNLKMKLSYADLTGKGNIVLCTKVGCNHNSSDCEADIVNFNNSPMFFWKDHLYYVDEISSHTLCRRDATGSGLMEIGLIGEKYLETELGWKIDSYIHIGEYMYYCASVEKTELVEGKTNEYHTFSVGSYIGRIHLTKGKDEVLVEQMSPKRGATLSLCAAREDAVLFLSSDGVDTPAEDPAFAETYRQMPVTLNCWSEKTGEFTKLFTKARKECSEIQLIWDGKLYYSTLGNNETMHKGNQYVYDLKTGKEKLIGEDTFFNHYGGGYALRKENEEEGYLLYSLKTGEVLPQEIEDPLRIVRACSNDGCVLQGFINNVITKEDGSIDTLREMVTYYVTYASLTDGMQESDLILLSSQKMGYS